MNLTIYDQIAHQSVYIYSKTYHPARYTIHCQNHGLLSINLPAGHTIDTFKLPKSANPPWNPATMYRNMFFTKILSNNAYSRKLPSVDLKVARFLHHPRHPLSHLYPANFHSLQPKFHTHTKSHNQLSGLRDHQPGSNQQRAFVRSAVAGENALALNYKLPQNPRVCLVMCRLFLYV